MRERYVFQLQVESTDTALSSTTGSSSAAAMVGHQLVLSDMAWIMRGRHQLTGGEILSTEVAYNVVWSVVGTLAHLRDTGSRAVLRH